MFDRYTDQRNRIDNPKIYPDTYGQPIFNKGGKNIKLGKDSLFSNWCWESCMEINDIIKLLKENIGETFSDINHINVFLGHPPTAEETETKINQWALIKLTSFCTAKGTIKKKKKKRQPMEWEKIASNAVTDKGSLSKIQKELIQLNSKNKTKQNNPPPKKQNAI